MSFSDINLLPGSWSSCAQAASSLCG